MFNIFLDDERQPNEAIYWEHDDKSCWITERPLLHWEIVKSHDEFVTKITKNGIPKTISFDHDLADEHYVEGISGTQPKYGEYKEKTGYECLKWLVEYCNERNLPLPKCYIHSFNPVGRENMFSLIENYERLRSTNNV